MTSFFFLLTSKLTVSGSACVHKRWGLTRRPQSWLATSGRSSLGSGTVRNRGATPKCHHSCKTAEHKSQITEICTPRPRGREKRAGVWVAAARGARWKWSHVVFAGIYPGARTSRFHSCWQTSACTCGRFCGNSLWINRLLCRVSDLRAWCPVNIALTVSARRSLAELLQCWQ